MRKVEKVLESKDGTKTPYSYMEPETISEAVDAYGGESTLKLINYALSVSERRKASPPSSTDIKSLINSDPELKALYEQKRAEKRAALAGGK